MKILGIDTSSSKGSIAITLKHTVISEISFSDQTSYSKKLFFLIDSILQNTDLNISQIDAFAVSIGPGSFTGLRVGISTVLGLSLAQKKPIISVETLLAMAHTIPFTEHLICPIIDARKGELYTSFFQYNKNGRICQLGEDQIINPETLTKEISKPTIFFGTGVDTYDGVIRRELGSLASFNNRFLNTAAASVAKLGYEKIENGEETPLAQLKPKYIRRSEAEMKFN